MGAERLPPGRRGLQEHHEGWTLGGPLPAEPALMPAGTTPGALRPLGRAGTPAARTGQRPGAGRRPGGNAAGRESRPDGRRPGTGSRHGTANAVGAGRLRGWFEAATARRDRPAPGGRPGPDGRPGPLACEPRGRQFAPGHSGRARR